MSALLEVVIGIVFSFLLVSLVVSAFTELVAAWTRWRAGNLWKALRHMIGPQSTARLLAHPAVATLNEPQVTRWLATLRLGPRIDGPSYVPAQAFATAILDIVLAEQQTLQLALGQLRVTAAAASAVTDAALLVRLLEELARALPASGPLDVVRQQVLRWSADLHRGELTPEAAVRQLEQLAAAAPALGARDWPSEIATLSGVDVKLRDALVAIARRAGSDIERFRAQIETWFDHMMDAVSGWYKRKVQAVNFCAALALALWLDVDTIRIAQVLWADSALRQAVVSEAERSATSAAPLEPRDRAQYWHARLRELQLPIGWCEPPAAAATPVAGPWWCVGEEIVPIAGPFRVPRRPYVYVGWLVTAIAATLGAPFWFDLLKRIVNIRSSGVPPELSREAGQRRGRRD